MLRREMPGNAWAAAVTMRMRPAYSFSKAARKDLPTMKPRHCSMPTIATGGTRNEIILHTKKFKNEKITAKAAVQQHGGMSARPNGTRNKCAEFISSYTGRSWCGMCG